VYRVGIPIHALTVAEKRELTCYNLCSPAVVIEAYH
jgi:hypothetical protein